MKINVDRIISADHQVIRQINRQNILNLIREKSPISRVAISRVTGLNKSTISNIISELIDEGLVLEGEAGESPVGRKPIGLSLNGRSRITGVIDVRLLRTTLAVCDIAGAVLERTELETVRGRGQQFLETCADRLAGMLARFPESRAGVGVSCPGIIDSTRGFFYLNKSLDWRELDIRAAIEPRVGCKVLVENDAIAAACAELWLAPEARDLTSFVFIWLCEGIGVGMVFNRAVYHGRTSLEGHFGDQVIGGGRADANGDTWEALASDTGTVHRWSELTGGGPETDIESGMQRVIDLARSGDCRARKLLRETARHLGTGIANINNGLGPERIILGGKILQAWELIRPELVAEVDRRTNYKAFPLEELIIPSSLPDAPFDGARSLVIADLFSGYSII